MLILDNQEFQSHLLLGTALYPSPQIMCDAIKASGTNIVTVSLRRESVNAKEKNHFWELIQNLNLKVLPNTAGCRTAKEAITTAQMARELFNTHWIKLEVIADNYTLQPCAYGLKDAAKELIAQGFKVFPYCTDDLSVASALVEAGCDILMPWAAPIGTAKGIINPYALKTLRARFKDITLIVDAGIGKPSDACAAMELGFDAVLLNTAVALASNPATMASSFSNAIIAGYNGYRAGLMAERDIANPSTPTVGTPFWHEE